MDLELLKVFGGLGVGGMLAGVMLWVKRNDDIRIAKERDEWSKERELHLQERIKERDSYQGSLLDLLSRQTTLLEQNTGAIKANTAAVQELGNVTTILEELRKGKAAGGS